MGTWILILTLLSSTSQTGNSISQMEFSSRESCLQAREFWISSVWKAKKDSSLKGYPVAVCVQK